MAGKYAVVGERNAQDGNGTHAFDVRERATGRTWCQSVSGAKRGMLAVFAAYVFPSIDWRARRDCDIEDLRESIRTGEPFGTLATLALEYENGGTPAPAPAPSLFESPAPTHTDTADTPSIEEIIRRIAEGAKSSTVDEEQVRVIVRDTVSEYAASLTPTVTVTNLIVNDVTLGTLPDVRHSIFEEVLEHAVAGENILLVGPSGSGKSEIAAQVAQVLGRGFIPESWTPDKDATCVFGFRDANSHAQPTSFENAYRDGAVYGGDELDNAAAEVTNGFNQGLANGHCLFASGLAERHPDFVFIGTANTNGTGPTRQYIRQALDAAFLDRFIEIECPTDREMERTLCYGILPKPQADSLLDRVWRIRDAIERASLTNMVTMRGTLRAARIIARGTRTEDYAVSRSITKSWTTDVMVKVGESR